MTIDTAPALASLRTPEGWLTASSGEGRFASLFGRDALIAALQLLPHDPSIADATLARLGRELGTSDDPEREEEPGKVPHEVRDADLDAYVAHGWPVRGGTLRYYGSIDAGAWFLILLAALARHGHPVSVHREAGNRVAAWLSALPQPVTYTRRATRGGLAHHWWRDVAADLAATSRHGMFADDGAPMRTPAAVAAVQALAWRALADAAEVLDPSLAAAAARARGAFGAAFLDAGAVPSFARHPAGVARAATSDLGIVLWTGVLDGRCAAATAARLLAPDLVTPFGVRTLPVTHPAFTPGGYHSGAVWPFDTWFSAGGLDAVEPGAGAPLRDGMRRAVEAVGGFPELVAVDVDGTLRASDEACGVQAWTVGAVSAAQAAWDGRSWP